MDSSYIEIMPSLHLIKGLNPSPFTYTGTNIYLLGPPSSVIMIDAGQDVPAYQTLLSSIISENKLKIDHIIITHFHPDHTLGLKFLIKHNPTIKIYKFLTADFETPPPSIDLNSLDLSYESFLCLNKMQISENLKIHTFDVLLQKELGFLYLPLKNNEVLNVNDYSLEILHLPGHSNDSIGIYEKKTKSFFAGDTILGLGSGTTINNASLYMKSLERIMGLDILNLLPGHGDVYLGAEKVKEQIYLFYNHRKKREAQIEECLEKGEKISFSEIFSRVYGEVGAGLVEAAKRNLKMHLEKLVEEGKVGIVEQEIYAKL